MHYLATTAPGFEQPCKKYTQGCINKSFIQNGGHVSVARWWAMLQCIQDILNPGEENGQQETFSSKESTDPDRFMVKDFGQFKGRNKKGAEVN